MDFISEDDVALVSEEWNKITVLRQKRTFEMRIKRETSRGRQAWILASGMPEEGEDGSLKSVMGCIADISLQKVCRSFHLDTLASSRSSHLASYKAHEDQPIVQLRSIDQFVLSHVLLWPELLGIPVLVYFTTSRVRTTIQECIKNEIFHIRS